MKTIYGLVWTGKACMSKIMYEDKKEALEAARKKNDALPWYQKHLLSVEWIVKKYTLT